MKTNNVEKLARVMMTEEGLNKKFFETSKGGDTSVDINELYERARSHVPELDRETFDGKVKSMKEIITLVTNDKEISDQIGKITSMAAGYEIMKAKLPDLGKDEYLNAMKAMTAISQSANNDEMLSDDDLEMAAGGLDLSFWGTIVGGGSFVATAAGAAAL